MTLGTIGKRAIRFSTIMTLDNLTLIKRLVRYRLSGNSRLIDDILPFLSYETITLRH